MEKTGAVDFGRDIGRMRPELHSSGFGPQSAGAREWDIEEIKSIGFNFRSGADAILLDAHGLEPSCDVRAWVHDNGRAFERYPVRMFGNRILLKKADSGCAAFFIESGLLWL